MSYILDALRKADADRERDPARGIHAQPAAGLPPRTVSAVPRWSAALAVLAVVAVTAYVMLGRDAPSADVAVARAAAPTPAPVAIEVVPAPAPAVVPVAAVVLPAAPPVVVAPPIAAPERPVAKPSAGVPAKPAVPVVAAVAPGAVLKAAPAPESAPASSADRVLAVNELPADVQRELPKLAISGGVHSDNAAQRMLIVGGQVMAEGAELAPGVVLEQIRAKSAVLRFRGFRYSVAY
jgi:general secretion pathway protein B